MLEGRTASGYEFIIDDEILKDWRFVKNLSKLTELEEDSEVVEIDFINTMAKIESVLFKDKGKSLEKHIQSMNNGTIPTDVLLKELIDVIKSNKETKN